ncbi:hypothetical protein [Myxococcus sp. AB036A]|uniref:hypothetical protein n=1 Tax=Myxococcus sp. AB036A TaxID=2562793 RepID=UPI0011465FA1|nr:hypothetical protein [Myxococcus sp. AB036A]
MKSMAGIFVMALVMLTSCGPVPTEEQTQVGNDVTAEDHFRTQEAALTGDCFVQIECEGGNIKSCYGTGFACSANSANGGTVTCNGNSQSCRPIIQEPICSCRADGCCNQLCAISDPDCRFVPEEPK